MTVECNGQSHNAAFSVVHDLNAIDQVVEDLSHVASGSFASLKDEWKDQAKKFVYSRDTLRHQYSRLQSKSIPRFINSGRQMLLGEADDDCVEVEWIAVNVGFEDLQETGSDCQNLWWNVYEEHGSATRLTDMITAGLRQLEDPSIKRIALLLPGMNGQDRRNSHDLLTEALSLMASLREAHASRQEIACSDSERRIMEASWRKATLKNIAGVAVRKDQSHTDLDNLVAQRLDWPMLHTSPDLAGLD